MDKKLLTPSEARKLLGLQTATVYMLLETGEIPAFKRGNRWKIPMESIDEWISSQTKGGEA